MRRVVMGDERRRCARRRAGPSSATTWSVVAGGRRAAQRPPAAAAGRRRSPPPPRRASAAPRTRRPRSAATPATAPAAAARPSGHQKVPCTSLDLDPRRRRRARANRAEPAIRPPRRSPCEAVGRWIEASVSTRSRSQSRSRCGAASRCEARVAPVAIGGETYRSYLRWVHAGARHRDSVSRPGDPDRGRLLVVPGPLPDHPLAVGLLPLHARRSPTATPRRTCSALASALAFFASILLHELGHAFVALRRGIGISDITLWMFGGVARMTRDSDSPGTEFKVAIGGPARHPRDRARLRGSRDRRRRLGGVLEGDASRRGGRHVRDPGGDRLAGEHQPAGPRLQPDPRLPAGRRADRTGDRLAGEREPQPGNAHRRAPRPGLLLPVHRRRHPAVHRGRRDRRDLAGADRLHPRAVGPRRRAADRVRQPDRGDQGGGRHGRRAGRDPGGRQRRARPRRVLPALSLALVPGGRRGAALSRPDRARRRRRGAGGEPRLLGGARRLRGGFDRHAPGARRRAARVAARQRCPPPARGADGGRRRWPPARRDHGRPGRPGAPQRARRRWNAPGSPATWPSVDSAPRYRISAPCPSTTYW